MLPIKDGTGAATALATEETEGVHTPMHRDADREALLDLLGDVLAKLIPAPATEAKQDAQSSLLALVGTRQYGSPLARVAVGAAATYSAAITATEVLVHASTRCFVGAVAGTGSPTVDNSFIPLEAGEKFHLRVTPGQRIGVVRDTADGFINIVPVAV